MKILYLILLPILLFGQSYTLKDSSGVPTNAQVATFIAGRNYVVGKITATADYTIKRIGVFMEKKGTPTMNFQGIMFTETGSNQPAAEIEKSSNTIAAASLPPEGGTYGDWVYFDFTTGYTVTNGTVLWVGVYSGTTDATNYMWTGRKTGVASKNVRSADASTWTQTTAEPLTLRLYEQVIATETQDKVFKKRQSRKIRLQRIPTRRN